MKKFLLVMVFLAVIVFIAYNVGNKKIQGSQVGKRTTLSINL